MRQRVVLLVENVEHARRLQQLLPDWELWHAIPTEREPWDGEENPNELPPAGVRRVAKGESVKWMGYGIRSTAGGLGFKVTVDAWDRLREAFVAAHGKPNSPIAALRSLAGWVADKGPCYKHTPSDWAYDQIVQAAAEQGFEEILSRDELKERWQRGYARWCKLQKSAAASGGVTAKGGK